MTFRARCRREEWREVTAENVAVAGDRAPCRRDKGGNQILVRCDQAFTDGTAFAAHMRVVHKVYPIESKHPPLTMPHDYRTRPILSRLARRKPNPALGQLDLLDES